MLFKISSFLHLLFLGRLHFVFLIFHHKTFFTLPSSSICYAEPTFPFSSSFFFCTYTYRRRIKSVFHLNRRVSSGSYFNQRISTKNIWNILLDKCVRQNRKYTCDEDRHFLEMWKHLKPFILGYCVKIVTNWSGKFIFILSC